MVCIGTVIGKRGGVLAKLFLVYVAECAMPTRIYHTTHSGIVTHLEFSHVLTDCYNFARHLMTEHTRLATECLDVVRRMQVAMADSGIHNPDLYIVVTDGVAGKLIIVKMSVFGMKGKALCRNAVILLCLTCHCQQQSGNQ